jgi:HK97 family phage major capsid protein
MNLKALTEKRAELQTEMENMVSAADNETRAMSAEEIQKFDAAEQAIKDIDATIEREERARKMDKKEIKEQETEERAEVLEERAFLNYIKRECGIPVENRAGEQNFTVANNGAVIPTSIATKSLML